MVWLSTGKIPMVAPYSGDMLPMVARSATVSRATPGPKNSTKLPTTPRFLSIWVTVSTRSVALTPALSRPESRKPTTCGISMEQGCPSSAASASMPAHPPADDSQAVDHRGVGVGADQGVRVDPGVPLGLGHHGDAGEVLEIHLVTDAGCRRHHAEVLKAPCPQRRNW